MHFGSTHRVLPVERKTARHAKPAPRTVVRGAGEVQLLRGMRDALVPKLPTSQRVELQDRLRAAVEAENYELAAILRDELRLMDG